MSKPFVQSQLNDGDMGIILLILAYQFYNNFNGIDR